MNHPFLFGYDFHYLWSGGALLHKGLNPYELEAYGAQLHAIGWPLNEAPCKFPHPVNTLWLYWLFALLPFRASLALWSVLSVAIIIWCSVSLVRALECQGDRSIGLIAFLAVLFPPTLGHIVWGQMNVVLLAGLAIFAWGWRCERWFLAGVGLSLTLLKPHLFAPFLLAVVFGELSRRRIALLVGCAVGISAQTAAAIAISPESVAWYRAAVDGSVEAMLRLCGATVGQQLACAYDVSFIRPTLLLGGSLAGVFLVRRLGYSLVTLLCVILPLSICVAPYAWMHSFVVLIPSFFWVFNRCASGLSESSVRYSAAAVAVACLPLLLWPHHQVLWIFSSWVLLLVPLVLLWPSKTQSLEET